MEKLIYPIWKRPDHTVEQFRTALLTETAPALLGTGVHQLRINIVDDAVAPADPLRQVNNPQPIDAMISAWVDTV
ncbi:MAG: hypothetical protein GY713_16765, partial [Actinomycetia bacterium]|nr:hypothetical protein [Actinomycetes bacterium]